MRTLIPMLLLCACFTPAAEVPGEPPPDSSLALDGELCVSSPADPPRALRVLIAIDGSASMRVADPNGTRMTAVADLLSNLPQDPQVGVALMMFSGTTAGWLTYPQVPAFAPLTSLTVTQRLAMVQGILTFQAPSASNATDFVFPLDVIRRVVAQDLSVSQGADPQYEIVFISDGHPTANQDEALLCGDAVRSLRALGDFGGGVRLHTVHVFSPTQPLTPCPVEEEPVEAGCGLQTWSPMICGQHIVQTDANRLRQMAQLGGGDFRDVVNNGAVRLDFDFPALRPTFTLETVVASNLSVLPGALGADLDHDGLPDAIEAANHLDPTKRDSDGDGLTDGVDLEPSTPNPGCSAPGADADCDGLTDCDEALLGTNPTRLDTDDDGLPDGVEFLAGTRPRVRDNTLDADADGVSNGEEIRAHSDPLEQDEGTYRYQLTPTDSPGQCFHLSVQGMKRASDSDVIYLSFTAGADDDPLAPRRVRQLRLTATNRVLHFGPGDFAGGCHTP